MYDFRWEVSEQNFRKDSECLAEIFKNIKKKNILTIHELRQVNP